MVAAVDPGASGSRDHSPYLGLCSYEEKDAELYFGREESIAELVRMVKRAPLTVVFGVSGIGKSSAIRAGIFPLVRAEAYLPVWIRLDFSRRQPDLAAQAKARVAQELLTWKVDSEPPGAESLGAYFARTPLWSSRNRLLTPLLVFDQFEELFTLGREHPAEIAKLVAELAQMIESDFLDESASAEVMTPRPRVIFSLREEFLAHLEPFRAQIPSLALNRFRLTRMTGAQALLAVERPAGAKVSHEVAKQIVEFVVSAGESEGLQSAELNTAEVEPTLLSLVCHELDTRRRELAMPEITAALITEQGGQIVERFYDRSFEGLADEMRVFVEQHLITTDGYRTTVARKYALEQPGVTNEGLDLLISRRVLRSERRFGAPHIELVHDRLTKVAMQGRARRLEAKREYARQLRTRRAVKIVCAIVAIASVAAVALTYGYVSTVSRHNREREQRAFDQRIQGMLIDEAREKLLSGRLAEAKVALGEVRSQLARVHLDEPPELALLEQHANLESTFDAKVVKRANVAGLRFSGAGLVTFGIDGSIWIAGERVVEGDLETRDASPGALRPAERSGRHASPASPSAAGTEPTRPEVGFATASDPGSEWAVVIADRLATAVGLRHKRAFFAQVSSTPGAAAPHVCIAPDGTSFTVWRSGARQLEQFALDPDAAGIALPRPLVRADKPVRQVICLDKGALLVLDDATSFVLYRESLANRISMSAGDELEQIAANHDASVIVASSRISVFMWKKTSADLADPWASVTPARQSLPIGTHQLELSPDATRLLVTTTSDLTHRVLSTVWTVDSAPALVFASDRASGFARWTPDGKDLVTVSPQTIEAWNTATWRTDGVLHVALDVDPRSFDVRRVGEALELATRFKTETRLYTLALPQARSTLVAPADSTIGLWQVARDETPPAPLSKLRQDETKMVADPHQPELVATLHNNGAVTLTNGTAVKLGGVHDLHFTATGELVVLATDRVQVLNVEDPKASGVVAEVPGWALAATYGRTPRPTVWTCDTRACTAWDASASPIRQRLGRVDIEAIVGSGSPVEISDDLTLLVSRDVAYLLPPITPSRSFISRGVKKLAVRTSLDVQDGTETVVDVSQRGQAVVQPAASPFGASSPIIAGKGYEQLIPGGRLATISPDGKTIAMCLPDDSIEVRDVAGDGAVPRRYVGARHVRTIYLANAGGRGQVVVARSGDGLTVWAAAGVPTKTWFGNFEDAHLDPGGTHLIATSGRVAHLFELADGVPTRRATRHADGIELGDTGTRYAVTDFANHTVTVVNWDGSAPWSIPYTGYDPEVRLQLGGGKHLWIRGLHLLADVDARTTRELKDVDVCIFGGNGTYIACVGTNHQIGFYTMNGTLFLVDPTAVASAESYFYPFQDRGDSRFVVAMQRGDQAEIRIWRPRAKDPIRIEKVHARIADLRLYDEELFIADEEGRVRRHWIGVQRIERGAQVADTAAGAVGVVDPQRGVVVVASGTARDVPSCKGATEAHILDAGRLACVVSDGRGNVSLVVHWSATNEASYLLATDASSLHVFQTAQGGMQAVVGLVDGSVWTVKQAALWSGRHQEWVWDAPVLTPLGVGATPIQAFAVDDSRAWLASLAQDGTTSVWRLQDGKELARMLTGAGQTGSGALAFAPGAPAPALYVGSPDGEIMRWNLGGNAGAH